MYITETGSVYHTSLDCSYLKLSVKQICHNEVVNYRSDDGSKYYACDRCEKAEVVFGCILHQVEIVFTQIQIVRR